MTNFPRDSPGSRFRTHEVNLSLKVPPMPILPSSRLAGAGRRLRCSDDSRRGGFTVLAALGIVLSIGFSALSVDLGMIAYTKTRLQNAADAAALAAAQEITAAVENVGQNGGSAGDANAIAETAARAMAVRVAALNGVYIDGQRDVEFGKRVYDKTTKRFSVLWDEGPYNVVRVTPRKDNPDAAAPDARLRLFFAPIFGIGSHAVTTTAAGFVEARDLILVLDYTASMNDDSTFTAMDALGRANIEANQLEIFEALELDLPNLPDVPEYATVGGVPASGSVPHIEVTFKGTQVYVKSTKDLSNVVLELLSPSNFSTRCTQKFEGLSGKTGTFEGTGSYNNWIVTKAWVKSGNNASGDGPGYGERFEFVNAVKEAFGLSGDYPYPAGGWDEYISLTTYYSRYNAWGGYNYKFGKLTFIEYLLTARPEFADPTRLTSGRLLTIPSRR